MDLENRFFYWKKVKQSAFNKSNNTFDISSCEGCSGCSGGGPCNMPSKNDILTSASTDCSGRSSCSSCGGSCDGNSCRGA